MVALKMGIHPGHDSFNHNDNKYMMNTVLCGKDHCLRQTRDIAFIRILFQMFVIIGVIGALIVWGFSTPACVAFCQTVLELFCCYGLLRGVKKVLPVALFPFLVLVILQFLGIFLAAIQLILIAILPAKDAVDLIKAAGAGKDLIVDFERDLNTPGIASAIRIISALMAVIFLFLALLYFWDFLVVKRCYSYLQAVKNLLVKNREIKPIS